MQIWLAAFAAALIVVIGYAGGPPGALVALLTFLIALFLLWARDLGFKGAWDRFGLQSLNPPLWKPENLERFKALFIDEQKLVKATTITVALIAAAMLLPRNLVVFIYAAALALGVFEVYRNTKAVTAQPGTRIN
ncbi:hypothetical protein [Rhodopseudomonas palustris]|uniref:Transmembrane protein n=1 Tax=Rhodopseudomonas palustris TaxID=1076 RepID=A0A418VD45_RHOPL|nr:hypothetical protein [Rhodopseudomonas palustris]RJF74078.1 hypothetical protein D4Q52_12990 [Rhodopseudomonas palustris]